MARTNRRPSTTPTGKLQKREPRPIPRRTGTRTATVRRAVREA